MKVDNNIFVRGMTGKVGDQFVVRKGKAGQTIIANKPSFGANRVFQPEQLAHQQAFREAIAYARSAKMQPIYINKADGTTMSVFNVAVADWFREPIVHEIDKNGWNGEIGEIIKVRAQDDTQVVRVYVLIRDSNGVVLEEGDAEQAEGLWWIYTATTMISSPTNKTIVATAHDLPGHSTELLWSI